MSSKFLPVHYFLRIVVATPAQPARFTFARCFDSKSVQLGVCGTVSPWQKLWAAASRENDLKVAAPNSSRQTLAMPCFSEWSVWFCAEWCFLFRETNEAKYKRVGKPCGQRGGKKELWISRYFISQKDACPEPGSQNIRQGSRRKISGWHVLCRTPSCR